MPVLNQTIYINSVNYAAVTQWQASHAYTVGQVVRQLTTPTAGNERLFICAVAGTSGSTEPSWNVNSSKYVHYTDGGVSWYVNDGDPALNGDLVNCMNWTANSSYSANNGVIIRDTASAHLFIMTTAGNSSATEPAWNTTTGATTTESGGAVWTCLGPVGNFGAWAYPSARVSRCNDGSANTGMGQTFYVSDNHAETWTTGLVLGTNQSYCSLLSVDHAASVPPTGVKAGASITNTNVISTGVWEYFYGLTFSCTGGSLLPGNGSYTSCKFDTCTFSLGSTINAYMQLSGNYNYTVLEFVNCTFNFGDASQAIRPNITAVLRNCKFTGALPTAGLFNANSSWTLPLTVEACDLSGFSTLLGGTASNFGSGKNLFKDCKLASGVTIFGTTNNQWEYPFLLDFNRCDSGTATYDNQRWTAFAVQTTTTTVVRTGGAQDGTTAIGHKIAMSAANPGYANTLNSNPSWLNYHQSIPLVIWNAVTGSNRNVTVYGVANDSRVPNSDEVWFDVEYLGSASSPLGSIVSGTKSNILATGTALTADTSAWDGAATARANTTAYTVGQVIKIASNPGRVFFCIGAGTSAAAEPTAIAASANTFNLNDKTASVTLSGGNLTAVGSAGGAVRSTGAQFGNKFYLEYLINVVAGSAPGILNGVTAIASFGSSSSGGSFVNSTGTISYNGANTGLSVGAISNGQTVCVAVDSANKLLWYRVNNGNWNGTAGNNPATGTGGIDISSVFSGSAAYAAVALSTSSSVTANFGATAFTFTPPSGFSAGPAQLGYVTAVDGDAIADGTATFRAGCRFSQTLTLGALASATTWNPSDSTGTITFSNGNLTASSGAPGQAVRSNYGVVAGKLYWEYTATTPGSVALGIGNSSTVLSTVATTGVNSCIFNVNGQIVVNNTTVVGNIGTVSSGAIIGVALDVVNQLIWFRNGASGSWNATSGSANNPATGTGGISISAIASGVLYALFAAAGGSAAATANFGASGFVGAVPSGFSAWNSLILASPQPQQAGYLYVFPKIGRPSLTYYLDPLPVLS